MLEMIETWLTAHGLNSGPATIFAKGTALLLVVLSGIIADRITKRFILRGVSAFIAKTKSKWDDALEERNFFNQIAHLAPAVLIYLLIPVALSGSRPIIDLIRTAAMIYMILLGILIVDSALNAGLDIYNTLPVAREIPIKSFVQVLKIVIYFVGAIFVISLLINKTPVYLFSGLGAMTAVLMFIFKDAILGFVAGIQLTANRMVSIGDWIEMPKYGADGDVLEVGLTTVKVQNWDKTVTTIPTYALISESFKNWRGMQKSGGRRIKRAIYIDIGAIKFCDEEMLNRYRNIRYISQYIEKKKQELAEYNKKVDTSIQINQRRLTNVGTFRAYVVAYLKHHSLINQEMTFLVRQLKPTVTGLPIEIYVFCKDKVWANYEAIQADIFDHILAAVPEFDLRIFQNPTGGDFKEIIKTG
ncbi:MAG TPA: mechanosensitive ion channel [Bacteroidetes bacterium]|nr:mechanosensitive ion channel [Bacteroidota bacterium]